ncbi:hypothetical protein P3540_23955, partial [Vibrio parahaemolyticus]|nr:hypothetical protein [Vibrio parahaemolyticus]
NPAYSKSIHTWLRFGEIMRGSLSAQRELQDLKMNLRDAQSKNANEAVSAIKKRMRSAEFMASLPQSNFALYSEAICYLVKTLDYRTVLKVLRRLK